MFYVSKAHKLAHIICNNKNVIIKLFCDKDIKRGIKTIMY